MSISVRRPRITGIDEGDHEDRVERPVVAGGLARVGRVGGVRRDGRASVRATA
jgi:hypothetical protein